VFGRLIFFKIERNLIFYIEKQKMGLIQIHGAPAAIAGGVKPIVKIAAIGLALICLLLSAQTIS
jgi:hypothetical protein